MSDEALTAAGDVIWPVICLVVIVAAIMGARSAYRNGVADGWRAHEYPTDPLWIAKVKPITDRFGYSWDMAVQDRKDIRTMRRLGKQVLGDGYGRCGDD